MLLHFIFDMRFIIDFEGVQQAKISIGFFVLSDAASQIIRIAEFK